jgi:hypothetical protein
MAGCGHCGGCCAHCGATCGNVGSATFGSVGLPSFGVFGGFGFHSSRGGELRSKYDDSQVPVDSDALVDPDHPGHRDAITSIAHASEETRNKVLAWLKEEFGKSEHEGDAQK